MTGQYVAVRLRFNIGHLAGYVLADQLEELLAAATDTGYVPTSLLVVERLTMDDLPGMVA
jgi:hypothetical protein